jgi:hypothetical protein
MSPMCVQRDFSCEFLQRTIEKLVLQNMDKLLACDLEERVTIKQLGTC